MPDNFHEELDTQQLSGGTGKRSWMIGYYSDAVAVDAWVKSYAVVPPIWGGLPIKLPPDISELGGGIWRVDVQYTAQGAGAEVQPESGAPTQSAPDHGAGGTDPVPADYSWGITGGTRHITQSLKTRQKAYRNGTAAQARNFGGGIGVNPSTGEVAGVDILGSEVAWQFVGQIRAAAFTGAYAKRIEELHATTNETTFFGYAPGECLFAGAHVDKANASGMRAITFDFLVKRNKAELVIYTNPTTEEAELLLENVRGWSHVWVTYETVTQTNSGVTRSATIPLEAYEEQVYPVGELNDLMFKARRALPPPPPPPTP